MESEEYMIHLEKVNSQIENEIIKLKVKGNQKDFVASNSQSLLEAKTCKAARGHVFPFGIFEMDTLVGFLMIGYDVDDEWENPPSIAYNNYSLWRLMIDEKYQCKGYGKEALKQAIEFVRTNPSGEAEYLYCDYHKDNLVAKQLYASLGFQEMMKEEEEIIAGLKL